jgi:methionyl-tRNA formyltransferase
VQHLTVRRIHGEEARSAVHAFAADLGLSLAAPILKPELFGIPRLGTYNLHKGKLPDYRGMPPAFWELMNREASVWCTIHRMDARLDTGPILLEGAVPIGPTATVSSLQLQLDELGIELLIQAIGALGRGEPDLREQPPGGTTFPSPTLQEEAALRRREQPSVPLQASAIRAGKDAVCTAYTYLARPLPRRILAGRKQQRIVILLYHRVNDEQRDSTTVGIGQFHRQMEMVARYNPRLSLRELLSGEFDPASRRPYVLVTFDDGYRDNYVHASPILLRHRIPATFFISTGIIGTEQGFQHDWTRLGKALPSLTWEQVREMQEMGFGFGSHTVNHVNLAHVDEETARRELLESRDALAEKLGIRDPLIAYPFGGRSDITPERSRLVREAGYTACFSAYGGINGPDFDRFDVKRMGIDHGFTEASFRARLEGFSR